MPHENQQTECDDVLRRLSAWTLYSGKAYEPTAEDLQILERFIAESKPFEYIRHQRFSTATGTQTDWTLLAAQKYFQSFPLMVVFSFSNDGYVRQAAVENLARIGEKGLPYLLIRSCDWVSAVARRATEEATKLIPAASDVTLSDCLKTLPLLQQYGKLGSPLGLRLLDEIQKRPAVLSKSRAHLPRDQKLLVYQLGLLGRDETQEKVIRSLRQDTDFPGLRRIIGQSHRLTLEEKHVLFADFKNHVIAAARREAVEIAAELGLIEELHQFLIDRNWRVRNDARFYLKKVDDTDFVEYYRARFPAAVAIAGFGEIAKDRDLIELLPFVGHPLRRTRYEAIKVLGNREVRLAADSIAKHLIDESPKIGRAAVKALSKIGHRLDEMEFDRMFAAAPTTKAQKVLIGALNFLPRWESIRIALSPLLLDTAPHEVDTFIHRWVSLKDVSRPTSEQLFEASKNFDQSHHLLPSNLVYWLRQNLEYQFRELDKRV